MKKSSVDKTALSFLFRQAYMFSPLLALLIILNSVVIFAVIFLAIVTKNLVDAAFSIEGHSRILENILLYLLIIVVYVLFEMGASFLSVYLNERFEFHVRRKMFHTILKSKWQEISAYHSEDLMVRLTSDIRSVASGIVDTFTAIVGLVISLFAAFITLFYYDKTIAMFAFALGPVAVCFNLYFGKKLKYYQLKVQENEAKYRAFMQENLANITVVKSFTNEEMMSEWLFRLYRERMKWVNKKNRLTILMSSTVSFSFSLGYIAALSWGVLKMSMNAMSFGTLTIFLNLVNRIQSPIIKLAQTIPNLSSVIASAGRIVEIDGQLLENYEKTAIKTSQMGIVFKDVHYSYHDRVIFENLNLTIKPGSFVAVTGASGIGKTTLIRLMMNFLEVDGGTIAYQYNSESGTSEIAASPAIRNYISYVPQGNTLFSGRIKDNLLIGNAEMTEEDIFSILESASLLDFVKMLPHGIDTLIGEKGHGLSEGQAERIAIARALSKAAPIMIFDEATAALDEKNEQEIIKSIRRIKNTPTCIFITHRRGTLTLMDEEINLEKLATVDNFDT